MGKAGAGRGMKVDFGACRERTDANSNVRISTRPLINPEEETSKLDLY